MSLLAYLFLFQSFSWRNIFFQCIHIFGERLPTGLRDFAGGAGYLAFEAFLYDDITCRAEFIDLHTQVARSGASLLLQIAEICLVDRGQNGHHGQPQLRMEKWV